jgi:hypothetical protein
MKASAIKWISVLLRWGGIEKAGRPKTGDRRMHLPQYWKEYGFSDFLLIGQNFRWRHCEEHFREPDFIKGTFVRRGNLLKVQKALTLESRS